MKRVIPVIILILVAAAAGGIVWLRSRNQTASPPAAGAAAAAPAADEEAGPQVSRDAQGNVVIAMSDETQGDIGILVKNPASFQMSPEVKGYGRVLDPGPLATALLEIAAAESAAVVSSNEVARLKTLEVQGNASTRNLQAAEATAMHDQIALHAAKDRLRISWGRSLAGQKDLPGFVQSLASLDWLLIRIDLPVGEIFTNEPTGARLSTLAGRAAEAEFLGPATVVDSQMQGQGFILRLKQLEPPLAVGEALVGFLKVPGPPLTGVIIPREAVVRTEGSGWVYVLNTAGDAFTRTEVALDNPLEPGWFVTKGVSASNYVVVAGAQQLLSIELKGAGGGGE